MTDWWSATPPLLLAIALVLVPGLLVARALGFRWWDAAGLAAPLGLGVLALANLGSSGFGVRWSLLPTTVTAVLISVVAYAVRALASRVTGSPSGRRVLVPPVAAGSWGRRESVLAALFTLAITVVGVVAICRGIPTPESLNQSFDAAFHVNAIDAIAQRHSASPSVFGQMSDPSKSDGFYPPTFAAIGSLLVLITGVSPIAAGNIVAVSIAALWPVSMSIMLRRFARPSVFGFAVAMVGTFTVLLFPTLPLHRGTVWPYALSVIPLGPALVLVARVLGVHRSRTGEGDPHGPLAIPAALVALAVIAPGIAYAQPSSLFLLFDLGLILLVVPLARVLAGRAPTRTRRWAAAIGGMLVALALFAGGTWLSWQIRSIAAVGRYYWPPVSSVGSAIVDVIRLATTYSPANLAFAGLALIGVVAGVRSARGGFLVAGWIWVGLLGVLAAAVQTDVTRYLTGFWYNNAYRIYAVIPVVVLPLAAIGADSLRTLLASLLRRVCERRASRWATAAPWISGALVCAGILGAQGGFGIQPVTHEMSKIYEYRPGRLISSEEAAMFRRLGPMLAPGERIAGSPWTGALLAGVLSGRPNVFLTFSVGSGAQVLVANRFKEYQTDPAVCAAVKRLRIGIVVTGPLYRIGKPWLRKPFEGFDNLGSVPGLTEIDSGGGATAYRVGPCRS